MRETEYDLCSSISRASLRAISTGRTSDLKARLKVPSTRPAILLSMLLSTVIERPRRAAPFYGAWSVDPLNATPGSRHRTNDQTIRTAAPAAAPTISADVVGTRFA